MRINTNGLYSFRYNPKGKEVLPVWDKTPLAFVLDITSRSMLCINLHWVPKKHREPFIKEVQAVMATYTSVGNKRIRNRMTYGIMKKYMYGKALKGIRRYLLNRVSNMKEVPESKWDKVLDIKKYKAHKVSKSTNEGIEHEWLIIRRSKSAAQLV